jgi:hypothetical protein
MTSAVLSSFSQNLAQRIELAVQSRTGGRIRGLQVRVANGGIVISGRVATYYTKQLVTHAAMEAGDELLVTNDVEVC